MIAPGPDVYEVDVTTGKTTKHRARVLLLRNASYGGSLVFDIHAGKPRRVATVNEEVVDAYDVEGTAIVELESGRFELRR